MLKIVMGMTLVTAVVGLLFYWLKNQKKTKREFKEAEMAKYGIEVSGVNLLENKILGIYQIYTLEQGKNYDITLPSAAYYSVVDEFSTVAISTNWNNRYGDTKKEGFHTINLVNNVLQVRWVNAVNSTPFLPKIIYIWR